MKEAVSTEWSLDEFYKGYGDPAYQADMERLNDLADGLDKSLQRARNMEAKEGLLCVIKAQEAFFLQFMRLDIYTSMRQSANTTDSETNANMAQTMKKYAAATKSLVSIQKYMAQIPNLEEVASSDPILEEYRFMLLKNREQVSHLFPMRWKK